MLATGACGPPLRKAKSSEEYQEEAEAAYNAAVESFLAEDWEIAVQRLAEVRKVYSYTRFARLAELRVADVAFRQEKFAEAAAAYRRFAHDYPTDPEVAYASYRTVRSQFLQGQSSVFQPPLEERELSSIRQAYASLRVFAEDHPNYPKRRELEYMLEAATGMLVRHELYVARFYLDRGRYEPAVTRAQRALERFTNSGLEAEAITLLGETYLKMDDRQKAIEAFERVLSEYPASPFAVPARGFLAFARGDRGESAAP